MQIGTLESWGVVRRASRRRCLCGTGSRPVTVTSPARTSHRQHVSTTLHREATIALMAAIPYCGSCGAANAVPDANFCQKFGAALTTSLTGAADSSTPGSDEFANGVPRVDGTTLCQMWVTVDRVWDRLLLRATARYF